MCPRLEGWLRTEQSNDFAIFATSCNIQGWYHFYLARHVPLEATKDCGDPQLSHPRRLAHPELGLQNKHGNT